MPDTSTMIGPTNAEGPSLRILVGVPCNLAMVPTDFVVSIFGIRTPAPPGGSKLNLIFCPGRHIAAMRERICELAVETNHTHVLMLDDDMVYEPDTLLKLLAADVDVICGFAMSRLAPHKPIFGIESTERYTFRPAWPTEDGSAQGKQLIGPQPSTVVGGAALLIKTSALRRLPRPWFSFQAHTSNGTEAGEDVWFSQLCRDNGVLTHVHPDVRPHHLLTMRVLPFYSEAVAGNGKPEQSAEWQVRYLPPWSAQGMEEQRRKERERQGALKQDLVASDVGELAPEGVSEAVPTAGEQRAEL